MTDTTRARATGAATAMGLGVVLVQTADPEANQVVAFRRSGGGALVHVADHPTGGRGGGLGGAVADRLASQGSLVHDAAGGRLYAVDAGSDTLVVFPLDDGVPGSPRRVPSGGRFPVSVAFHGDLVYVLNARDGGSIQGLRHEGNRLVAVEGAVRPLGLDTTTPPEFTHTPGQVGFSPDGRHLLVTTKADAAVLVFAMGDDGRPGAEPRRHPLPGAVPFGFVFTPADHLVVAEAGSGALASFRLGVDGSLVEVDRLVTGQAATCWVTAAGDRLFAANAGSSTVTVARVAPDGRLALVGSTPTSAGPVDLAVSPDGRSLYVQAGTASMVDAFAVGADGSLSPQGSVAVPGAPGGQGIVAL